MVVPVDALHLTLIVVAAALLVTLVLQSRRQINYRRTLQQLPVGLCTIGSSGLIRLWNRQMAEISGISARQATGRRIAELDAPWPEALQEALGERSGDVIKRPIGGPQDSIRWVILHSSGGSDLSGERSVLVEDISDYQRLEDDLLHRERLASIGRLAAGVAHEIGNPVTGIACLAQNLGELGEGAEAQQTAEDILRQTDRISKIVNSLVQFSHSGGDSQLPNMAPCNLADCVDEAIHLLSLDREASRDGFENRCDREQLVMADNQLLLQVFVNLLDNARAASDPGRAVRVSMEQDGDQVSVHVDNSGEVIPPAVLEQIFEPFFTTKEVGAGTGLGLPLVRGMLDDMGGHIDIASPAPGGAGTRATLRLRRAEYGQEVHGD